MLILALMLAVAEPVESPRLRHGHYLVLLPSAPETPVRLALRSTRHSPRYGDPLRWELFVGDASLLARGTVPLETTSERAFSGLADRLHGLRIETGWALGQVRLEGAAWAVVGDPRRAVSTVGEADWYLWQPAGRPLAVSVGARVTREGCRVLLGPADAPVAIDQSGDFDEPETFRLPAVEEARAVRLQIAPPPPGQGWHLDDVEVYLPAGGPPYLAPTAASAERLGRRWEAWSAR